MRMRFMRGHDTVHGKVEKTFYLGNMLEVHGFGFRGLGLESATARWLAMVGSSASLPHQHCFEDSTVFRLASES